MGCEVVDLLPLTRVRVDVRPQTVRGVPRINHVDLSSRKRQIFSRQTGDTSMA